MRILVAIFFVFFSFQMFSQEQIVADLKVQGNNKLKTSFVKKLSKVKSGTLLDSTMIEEDIKRLKRLPSVAHAYYQIFPAEKD